LPIADWIVDFIALAVTLESIGNQQLAIGNLIAVLSKLAVVAHARAAFCLANVDSWTSAHTTPP
jgi:hypothetical protein